MEDEAPRLLKALALSQRFHLYVAQCASPRAADRLIHAIETELPKLRGAPVRVVRLEPYAGQATDAPLTTELNDRVLLPLLAPPAERRGHGTIHVVDASRATSSDDDTWARLFASWNEKRNRLQQLGGEVVVVLPPALALGFATEAPDVWSIRSGEYEIGEPATEVAAARSIEVRQDAIDERLASDDGGAERAWPPAVVGAPRDAPVGTAGGTVRGHAPGAAETSSRAMLGDAGEPGAGPVAPGAPPVPRPARLPDLARPATWRLIPPLSLFGGDVVIAAWFPEAAHAHETRGIRQPPVRALDGDDLVSLGRALRWAEVAIGDRRFADAERLLAGLADRADVVDPGAGLRVRVALALALAAQDRPAEAWSHAEAAQRIAAAQPKMPHARADALAAAAYVAWCRGQLAHAASLDDAERLAMILDPWLDARMLRAMERGDLTAAKALAKALCGPIAARKLRSRPHDAQALAWRMVAADFAFLGEDVANARRDVEDAVARAAEPAVIASGSIVARARPLAALLAVAQGDLDGAGRALRGAASPPAAWEGPPDAAPRQAAFAAYAAGVVARERGDRGAALARFAEAHQAIARWAQVGFDRRSLWRAHVATLLSACEVDDDPARAAAAALDAQQRADVLVGDTGEDHIARVLAVLARRARRRHIADAAVARALAHEAAELAAPLRIDGALRWSALAEDAEREAG